MIVAKYKMFGNGSVRGVRESAHNKKVNNRGNTKPTVKGHGMAGTQTVNKRVNTPKP